MTAESGSGTRGKAPIDYERLVREYEIGLVETLRSFGPAEQFLELWVPDEDPVVSLCNLVDAAGAAGHDSVSVFVGSKTAADIDQANLRRRADDLGEVRIEAAEKGLRFDIDGIQAALAGALDGTPSKRVSDGVPKERPGETGQKPATELRFQAAVYASALAAAAGDIGHAGEISPADGVTLVEAVENEVHLRLSVDNGDHVIHQAAHGGTASADDGAVLDRFCRLIEGKPIQEASDHGVIRLEFALRDRHGPRAVHGVFIPGTDTPVFGLPLRLIRAALADYREKTGYAETDNRFDPQPSGAWLALGDEERCHRISVVIADVAAKNQLPPGAVEVVAIEHDVRVVLQFQASIVAKDKRRYMMIMEKDVKERVDDRLELYQEELVDKNVIRRLSETDEPR